MYDALLICDPCELDGWYMPSDVDMDESVRANFHNACKALTAVITGQLNLTRASQVHHLCRKRLRRMVAHAPLPARDGHPNGFRVCIPWGSYVVDPIDGSDGEMPRVAGPHAVRKLLLAQPEVAALVDAYCQALPPGKPPKSFDRLHGKIVALLKRLDLGDYYPLNRPDHGRQALLRHIRNSRIDLAGMGDFACEPSAHEAFTDLFHGTIFSTAEFDAHHIDIEAVMGVQLPNGGIVKRPITSIWILVEIERVSRAILSWSLRVGRAYNNLDLSICIGRALQSWTGRDLTIPDLTYAPGAGLPSGVMGDQAAWRVGLVAMDNAMSHKALAFEQAFCRAHGGILHFGKAHTPRSRAIVEQLFSRLERGAVRHLPGGFEPATRLGKNKIRISNFGPHDCPIQLHLLEQLLEVIIANYNATPHPALGNLTPLQFLRMQTPGAFAFVPDTADADAADMTSVLVPLTIHGDKANGVLPHVNYKYVRYRSPDLDHRWELVGTTVLGRVQRDDLRTIVLLRTPTRPLCAVRAISPWSRTPHDETTRTLIMQWSKLREGFSIVGAECAIAAYVAFLRQQAPHSQKALDQLARMDQISDGTLPEVRARRFDSPIKVPPGGWISLDDPIDP